MGHRPLFRGLSSGFQTGNSVIRFGMEGSLLWQVRGHCGERLETDPQFRRCIS